MTRHDVPGSRQRLTADRPGEHVVCVQARGLGGVQRPPEPGRGARQLHVPVLLGQVVPQRSLVPAGDRVPGLAFPDDVQLAEVVGVGEVAALHLERGQLGVAALEHVRQHAERGPGLRLGD